LLQTGKGGKIEKDEKGGGKEGPIGNMPLPNGGGPLAKTSAKGAVGQAKGSSRRIVEASSQSRGENRGKKKKKKHSEHTSEQVFSLNTRKNKSVIRREGNEMGVQGKKSGKKPGCPGRLGNTCAKGTAKWEREARGGKRRVKIRQKKDDRGGDVQNAPVQKIEEKVHAWIKKKSTGTGQQ